MHPLIYSVIGRYELCPPTHRLNHFPWPAAVVFVVSLKAGPFDCCFSYTHYDLLSIAPIL